MYLTDMLRKLGDRLGIIEMAPASAERFEGRILRTFLLNGAYAAAPRADA